MNRTGQLWAWPEFEEEELFLVLFSKIYDTKIWSHYGINLLSGECESLLEHSNDWERRYQRIAV